ncbi:MAG: hypothetical protein ACFCU7_16030 [Pleurocapsa sp.]
MFKRPKELPSLKNLLRIARRDRSMIFKETLLDASSKNKFGFQEKDILPLFEKYQSKRQILINFVSFLTYVLQMPTLFYLRRLNRSNTIYDPNSRYYWRKTLGNSSQNNPEYKS